ncbi:MAG: Na+/H+ antiporter NhaA [Bdellovibrionales bacterium]|nr:Na+/H+ antiporter NhaA [Bdellovibrionales bacterium]
MIKQKAQVRAQKVVKTIVSPIERFLALETSGGILLVVCTVIAMFWANSQWAESYHDFIHFPLAIKIGDFVLEKSLHHWVNDGLMVVFFYVVGLEIKRELVAGELSTPKKAALPMLAALGGMLVPAGIYALFNVGGPGAHGWGIPMATDIAFAVGIVTMLNKKVPFSLKIFLLALAIVDDLGAVIVIATFYTEQISTHALGIAALAIALISLLNLAGVRSFLIYILLSLVVWLGVLESGIHATIAGVIIGFLTPIQPFTDKKTLLKSIDELAEDLAKRIPNSNADALEKLELTNEIKDELHSLGQNIRDIESPLERLIHIFHPYVTFLIMPIFALVNAGVHIEHFNLADFFNQPVSVGVVLGLLLGKPIGVVLASIIAVKLNLGKLPNGANWYQMACMGVLAGIGFTMALFVSGLAFKSPELQMEAKLGILIASLLATIVGAIMLLASKDVSPSENSPKSDDQ